MDRDAAVGIKLDAAILADAVFLPVVRNEEPVRQIVERGRPERIRRRHLFARHADLVVVHRIHRRAVRHRDRRIDGFGRRLADRAQDGLEQQQIERHVPLGPE